MAVVNFFLLFILTLLPYVTAQTPPPPPPPNSFSFMGPKFNGTMAIVTVILVSMFFILGFFSVYIRQCTARRFRRNNSEAFATVIRGANHHRSLRGVRGLDDSIIDTFPTFLYSAVKELKIGKVNLECAVCLNEFEDEETLRLIPKCSHVFHMDCIDAWLCAHNTCPVCRANLVPRPGETPTSFLTIFNPDSDSGQPEQGSDDIQEVSQSEQKSDEEAPPDVNLTNQNHPPRSISTGWRRSGWFPRSHSTGHSLVQQGQDRERYMLRLPTEVRSKLMNSSLNRSRSCVAFPRARSSRRGFRSSNGGGSVLGRNHNLYERFGLPSRSSSHWELSLTPPFIISRSGSVRTPRTARDGVDVSSCMPSRKKL